MNRVPTIIVFLCLFTNQPGYSQSKKDDPFAKISAPDFTTPSSPAIDSNSNAVVIADLGVTSFKGNMHGSFSYVFKRKTRVLILNKTGFELATVKIPLRSDGEYKQELSEVAAVTYNLENGNITENKFSKSDLFTDKIEKGYIAMKFTLPGVKVGSIIEYSYTVTSDFIMTMPEWSFQRMECPTLWSECQVTIPNVLSYMTVRRGIHSYYIDKGSEGRDSYQVTQQGKDREYNGAPDRYLTVNANTIKHRWVMKDLPALYPESYLTTPRNYLDELDFQLHQTTNGETVRDVTANWASVTETLLKNPDFGLFMTEEAANSDWMKAPLATITSDSRSLLQQAQDVYYFVSGNFDCTNHYDKWIGSSLKEVYKKKSGGVGELNLLLTAMLRKRNIDAVPVLLNTREYGYNVPSYPVITRINYVICKATIDNRVYYLDASYHHLGFGFLPGNCYNGYARAISPADTSSIYFTADSLKEQEITLVNIVNSDNGKNKLQGSFEITPGYIQSHALRESIATQGEKPFFTKIETDARGFVHLTKTGIDSLKLKEYPVKVWGDFDFNTEEGTDVIYFTPMMWAGRSKNPFEAAVRKYPVEMNYPVNETYILNMQIPDGFTVDEMPKSIRSLYNGGEGEFTYLAQKSENMVQLRCTIHMKSAEFDPGDYAGLRDFFALIVKKQDEQIVFKKKAMAASSR